MSGKLCFSCKAIKPLGVVWFCQGCHKKVHAYEDIKEQIMQGDIHNTKQEVSK